MRTRRSFFSSASCRRRRASSGSGTGSELRNPLGITIIGGLLLSQLLTLYTTPVIYLQMEWLRARLFGAPHREIQQELDLPLRGEPSQHPAE